MCGEVYGLIEIVFACSAGSNGSSNGSAYFTGKIVGSRDSPISREERAVARVHNE